MKFIHVMNNSSMYIKHPHLKQMVKSIEFDSDDISNILTFIDNNSYAKASEDYLLYDERTLGVNTNPVERALSLIYDNKDYGMQLNFDFQINEKINTLLCNILEREIPIGMLYFLKDKENPIKKTHTIKSKVVHKNKEFIIENKIDIGTIENKYKINKIDFLSFYDDLSVEEKKTLIINIISLYNVYSSNILSTINLYSSFLGGTPIGQIIRCSETKKNKGLHDLFKINDITFSKDYLTYMNIKRSPCEDFGFYEYEVGDYTLVERLALREAGISNTEISFYSEANEWNIKNPSLTSRINFNPQRERYRILVFEYIFDILKTWRLYRMGISNRIRTEIVDRMTSKVVNPYEFPYVDINVITLNCDLHIIEKHAERK